MADNVEFPERREEKGIAKTARNTARYYIEYDRARKRNGVTMLSDELEGITI